MTLKKRSGPTPQQWVASAVAVHKTWPGWWRKAYAGMLEVGFQLIRGKEACPDLVEPENAKCPHEANGRCYFCNLLMSSSPTWDLTLKKEAPDLRLRQVDSYMELSGDALGWVLKMHAQIEDRTKQEAVAATMMILSPRPFVRVLRDAREMQPFGEYNAIKYRQQKRLGSGQLELDFDSGKVEATMAWLAPLADPKSKMILPEGQAPGETWQKLKSLAQRLVERADQELGEINDV
jgi:hypothetical protein